MESPRHRCYYGGVCRRLELSEGNKGSLHTDIQQCFGPIHDPLSPRCHCSHTGTAVSGAAKCSSVNFWVKPQDILEEMCHLLGSNMEMCVFVERFEMLSLVSTQLDIFSLGYFKFISGQTYSK